MKNIAAAACLVCFLGCRSQGQGSADAGNTDAGGDAGTPVKTARVVKATLAVTVTGPGHTDALEQQKVRAPFKGVLLELRVADGDRVKGGQVVAVLAAQESEAALIGARAMLRSAGTAQQRSDARRALKLARRGVVKTMLKAPEAGVVVSHGADEGALVAEAQDLVSLAATDSFVFIASVAQDALPTIHRGQPVEVRLSAQAGPLRAKVYGTLAAASATDLVVPVRVDFDAGNGPKALGLFGTAVITVGERRDVPVVPQAAVLRDDINGTQRVAVVSAGKVHWEQVKTGVSEGGRVEITSPPLSPGAEVVVDGQVGLPEGAPVAVGSADGGKAEGPP